jgi:uncharacterized protein (TIGR00297 family)
LGTGLFNLLLLCALALPFGWLAVRMRVLTKGGSLMAVLVAVAVVLSQGWVWLAPLFFFLISGVLLGRLNKAGLSDAKHGRPRDAIQVVCNGGLYALLAAADDFHADLWMTISLCTAICDTWASEIGIYARWPTINIATLRRVAPGLSGGISLAGTLGGFGGSMLMGLFICACMSGHPPEPGWHVSVISTVLFFWASLWYSAFALGGMLLDSLLGAVLQPKYDDGDGPRDTGTRQVSGVRWMTNDAVNLISNAITVGVAMVVL